jgi:pimeloyl-ACP methyl ester carboxylesterase
MSRRRRGRLTGRGLTLSAAAGGVAAGVAIQRRHLGRIAADEDLARLNAPLDGRPLTATSADGTRLYAEAFGPRDGLPVILAHGWTERLTFWGPVIHRLAERGLRPVAYDLRGHGRSAPAVADDYALERFGEDLEAVLVAATREGERAVVVGHSLGAMSIAAWAERHDVTARVSAAALLNTGLGDLISGHLLFGEVAKRLHHPVASRAFLGSRTRMPPFSSPLQQAVIRYVAFGPNATAGQVAFYERMLMQCSPEVRGAVGVALSDMDLWHAVAKITVPTLVVAGAQDRLTPPSHARRIADTLPHLHALVEMPATGHMAPLERPDELTKALVELIGAATTQASGRVLSCTSPDPHRT